MSPSYSIPSERERLPISALNNVIHLLICALSRQKFRIFFTCTRRDRECDFLCFCGWVACNSVTASTEHQFYTQRAWIIGGEVVDVPFRVINPTDKGIPMGNRKPPNFSVLSNTEKFAEFSDTVIFKVRQNMVEISAYF